MNCSTTMNGMFLQDSYQLALELDKAWKQSTESGAPIDIASSLRRYRKSFFFMINESVFPFRELVSVVNTAF